MPSTQEVAILVGLHLTGRAPGKIPSDHSTTGSGTEESLAELASLAATAGARVAERQIQSRPRADAATLIGSGKVEELKAQIHFHNATVVICDRELTPTQQRNLERFLKVKAIDRTGLILEIFGARARTAEGMLQVELAALTYQRSRLVRSWTHLERQRGGFGFLGGPGESQNLSTSFCNYS